MFLLTKLELFVDKLLLFEIILNSDKFPPS